MVNLFSLTLLLSGLFPYSATGDADNPAQAPLGAGH